MSHPPTTETAPRSRGRPRSLAAQNAVLNAAFELTAREGLRNASIDAIARESGVSKMTIYKWWPSRLSLLIDALLQRMADKLPLDETGHPPTQIREHAGKYVAALNGELGRMQLAVIAECLAENGDTGLFVERYLAHRRALGVRIIARGQREGSIANLHPAAALYDQVYGTLFYRHMFGLGGLTRAFAIALVDTLLLSGSLNKGSRDG